MLLKGGQAAVGRLILSNSRGELLGKVDLESRTARYGLLSAPRPSNAVTRTSCARVAVGMSTVSNSDAKDSLLWGGRQEPKRQSLDFMCLECRCELFAPTVRAL